MTHRIYSAAAWLLWVLPMSLALPGGRAAAGDWPQWRGPRGDGHSDEKDVPTRWSAPDGKADGKGDGKAEGTPDNIAWKADLPGRGHSSPIVVGDRVFLTTCLEDKGDRLLLCLSRLDGRELWRRVVLSAPLEKKHSLNNYASSTPACDGSRVFVAFLKDPAVVVACYDLDGNEQWRKSPGTFHSMHGWAAAPVLYKDTIILNCDQDAPKGTGPESHAFLVALERATGAERWRIDRPHRIRSYCDPLIVEAAGKAQMVLTGAKTVASYDPDTGKPYWEVDGPTEQFVASPVYAAGVVCITGGFPEMHQMGIRPDGEGNVSATHVLWHDAKHGAYVPSPIAAGEWFFVVSDEGQATCLEAKTGRKLWTHRLGRHHRPSPVFAGGNLYFLADDGETFVLKAGPQYELVSRNALGEECYASPAISRGQIFIRGVSHLYCIGKARG